MTAAAAMLAGRVALPRARPPAASAASRSGTSARVRAAPLAAREVSPLRGASCPPSARRSATSAPRRAAPVARAGGFPTIFRGAAATTVTAESVVRGMYDAINRRDVAAALEFVDDDILYEDFNFPKPFRGKAAVKKLFEESCDGIPDDMLFIVDECTDGGGISVGMTWYVELEGEPFPNARGASLYPSTPRRASSCTRGTSSNPRRSSGTSPSPSSARSRRS